MSPEFIKFTLFMVLLLVGILGTAAWISHEQTPRRR